jgi:uracil-DNA glycosylase family 4
MEEFSEEELNQLISEALSKDPVSANPLVPSGNYLGLAETDLMESLHVRLSKKIIESDLLEIFKEVRKDILTRSKKLTLHELHTVIKNCNKCSIESSSELPKWNVKNPDIAIVVDSPSMQQDAVNLMIDAFKDAQLTSEQLCLTYVNRCPVYRKYESQEVLNCTPYLHSELEILNPRLIVALGGTPASVLFGSTIKMKESRGQIKWLGSWPILATYSPTYSIRSGEYSVESFKNDIKQAKQFLGEHAN